MNLEVFIEKLIGDLQNKLGILIYLAGQKSETAAATKWGTIQPLEVKYHLPTQGHKDGIQKKIWTCTLQFNINSKYNNSNAFESLELTRKVVEYLSKEYYYNDVEINTRTHYPIDISPIRDIPNLNMQSLLYTKSVDITFRGEETFDFVPAIIEKVSGEVIEYPSELKENIIAVKRIDE